jgi:DNA-binding MarR family transcriptional regulator
MTEPLRRALLGGERSAAIAGRAGTGSGVGGGGHARRRDPGDTAGFLLWRTTLRWQRAIATALRPLGLTHVQFALLSSVRNLARDGVRPNQRQVADHAGTDVMMTSQVLRTLESRGLVTRVADATDARAKRLVVTGDGVRLADYAASVVQAADRAFFAEVRDRAQLLEALRLLAGR